eukprot:GHVH01004983.1.p1 GENE.GHVH01004983.1~~GHVH01004983.1.p1  ORF type:complete len:1756 (+),score=256.63 GHVH01004983.1:739-6006(+)
MLPSDFYQVVLFRDAMVRVFSREARLVAAVDLIHDEQTTHHGSGGRSYDGSHHPIEAVNRFSEGLSHRDLMNSLVQTTSNLEGGGGHQVSGVDRSVSQCPYHLNSNHCIASLPEEFEVLAGSVHPLYGIFFVVKGSQPAPQPTAITSSEDSEVVTYSVLHNRSFVKKSICLWSSFTSSSKCNNETNHHHHSVSSSTAPVAPVGGRDISSNGQTSILSAAQGGGSGTAKKKPNDSPQLTLMKLLEAPDDIEKRETKKESDNVPSPDHREFYRLTNNSDDFLEGPHPHVHPIPYFDDTTSTVLLNGSHAAKSDKKDLSTLQPRPLGGSKIRILLLWSCGADVHLITGHQRHASSESNNSQRSSRAPSERDVVDPEAGRDDALLNNLLGIFEQGQDLVELASSTLGNKIHKMIHSNNNFMPFMGCDELEDTDLSVDEEVTVSALPSVVRIQLSSSNVVGGAAASSIPTVFRVGVVSNRSRLLALMGSGNLSIFNVEDFFHDTLVWSHLLNQLGTRRSAVEPYQLDPSAQSETIKMDPDGIAWVGDDCIALTVLLPTPAGRYQRTFLLGGPRSRWIPLPVVENKALHLFSVSEGCLLLSSEGVEGVQQVPRSIYQIGSLGSDHPAAVLWYACRHLDKRGASGCVVEKSDHRSANKVTYDSPIPPNLVSPQPSRNEASLLNSMSPFLTNDDETDTLQSDILEDAILFMSQSDLRKALDTTLEACYQEWQVASAATFLKVFHQGMMLFLKRISYRCYHPKHSKNVPSADHDNLEEDDQTAIDRPTHDGARRERQVAIQTLSTQRAIISDYLRAFRDLSLVSSDRLVLHQQEGGLFCCLRSIRHLRDIGPVSLLGSIALQGKLQLALKLLDHMGLDPSRQSHPRPRTKIPSTTSAILRPTSSCSAATPKEEGDNPSAAKTAAKGVSGLDKPTNKEPPFRTPKRKPKSEALERETKISLDLGISISDVSLATLRVSLGLVYSMRLLESPTAEILTDDELEFTILHACGLDNLITPSLYSNAENASGEADLRKNKPPVLSIQNLERFNEIIDKVFTALLTESLALKHSALAVRWVKYLPNLNKRIFLLIDPIGSLRGATRLSISEGSGKLTAALLLEVLKVALLCPLPSSDGTNSSINATCKQVALCVQSFGPNEANMKKLMIARLLSICKHLNLQNIAYLVLTMSGVGLLASSSELLSSLVTYPSSFTEVGPGRHLQPMLPYEGVSSGQKLKLKEASGRERVDRYHPLCAAHGRRWQGFGFSEAESTFPHLPATNSSHHPMLSSIVTGGLEMTLNLEKLIVTAMDNGQLLYPVCARNPRPQLLGNMAKLERRILSQKKSHKKKASSDTNKLQKRVSGARIDGSLAPPPSSMDSAYSRTRSLTGETSSLWSWIKGASGEEMGSDVNDLRASRDQIQAERCRELESKVSSFVNLLRRSTVQGDSNRSDDLVAWLASGGVSVGYSTQSTNRNFTSGVAAELVDEYKDAFIARYGIAAGQLTGRVLKAQRVLDLKPSLQPEAGVSNPETTSQTDSCGPITFLNSPLSTTMLCLATSSDHSLAVAESTAADVLNEYGRDQPYTPADMSTRYSGWPSPGDRSKQWMRMTHTIFLASIMEHQSVRTAREPKSDSDAIAQPKERSIFAELTFQATEQCRNSNPLSTVGGYFNSVIRRTSGGAATWTGGIILSLNPRIVLAILARSYAARLDSAAPDAHQTSPDDVTTSYNLMKSHIDKLLLVVSDDDPEESNFWRRWLLSDEISAPILDRV